MTEVKHVVPKELLARAQASAGLSRAAEQILRRTDPPGTPDAKMRLGYVLAFDPTTWTCTASIGDQLTQVSGIPVLAGVMPVAECAGQFVQVGNEYTLIGMLAKGPGNLRIRKSAAQSIFNTGTITNDTELKFYGQAGRSYIAEVLMLVSQNTLSDMDFNLGWNLPSGATWSGYGPGPVIGIAVGSSSEAGATANWRAFSGIAPGTTITFGIEPTNVAARLDGVQLHCSIKMGATSGMCNVGWSQRVPLNANTTVNEGSYLKVDMTGEYTL